MRGGRVVGRTAVDKAPHVERDDRTAHLADDPKHLPGVIPVESHEIAVTDGPKPGAPAGAEQRQQMQQAVRGPPQPVGVSAPVPRTDQLEQGRVDGLERRPCRADERLVGPDDLVQVADQRWVESAGGVGQRDGAELLAPVDQNRGEEAGHRAAVADQRAPVDPTHPQTQAVRRPGGRARIDPGGLGHLVEGRGGQHVAGITEQEGREPGQVGQRGPELPGGSHRAAVMLRFSEQGVGPGMHRPAGGPTRGAGPAVGSRRGPRHAQGSQHLVADHLGPAPAAQDGNELAEHAVTQVGVVEAAARTMRDVLGGQGRRELRPGRAGHPFPPVTGAFRTQPGVVGEQLPDSALTKRGARNMQLQRIIQVESAFVA